MVTYAISKIFYDDILKGLVGNDCDDGTKGGKRLTVCKKNCQEDACNGASMRSLESISMLRLAITIYKAANVAHI